MKTVIKKPTKTVMFEFEVDCDWIPGQGNCEDDCPFEGIVVPDDGCFAKVHGICPFACNMEEDNGKVNG